MSDETWSDIFKIFVGNDGSYNLYLEEQESCIDLVEQISREINISDFAELKASSTTDPLAGDYAIRRLDSVRKSLPEMAIKIAKLSERELLDLAQEIIQVVQNKNKVKLEIVK